jgi:hypothetical protein
MLTPVWVSEFGLENLGRDRPVVLEILRQIAGRHPAAAEFAFDPVAVAETFDESRRWVSQRRGG